MIKVKKLKNIIKIYILCKRFSSSPEGQPFVPLLFNRIEQSPSFPVVGIDFGAPLHVKDSDERNYIVLFTCEVTQALHLEVVGNMTTETFHLALWFICRGLCSHILTDNARTFMR